MNIFCEVCEKVQPHRVFIQNEQDSATSTSMGWSDHYCTVCGFIAALKYMKEGDSK